MSGHAAFGSACAPIRAIGELPFTPFSGRALDRLCLARGVIIRLAVLGDSIAWGQGATRERDRLSSRLVDGLASRGIDAEARVFAVPGATSSGLVSQVGQALSWRPDLAVVVIGANDLTHLLPVEVAAQALGDAVRRLRAGGAEVVVAPAPDLSAVPHVPAFLRETVRAAGDLLRDTSDVGSAGRGRAPRGPRPARITSLCHRPVVVLLRPLPPLECGVCRHRRFPAAGPDGCSTGDRNRHNPSDLGLGSRAVLDAPRTFMSVRARTYRPPTGATTCWSAGQTHTADAFAVLASRGWLSG